MKLIYIKPSRSRGYLILGLTDGENKYPFTVSETDYADVGSPISGDEIDAPSLSAIKRSDERYRATIYALRILSYGDNSKRNLYQKLIKKGISGECASEVVRDMSARGYINEEDQLLRLVEREVNSNLSGRRKIYARLMNKGFSRSQIDTAIDTLVFEGRVDFEESKRILIEKKLTRDATCEEKKALLYKYGY